MDFSKKISLWLNLSGSLILTFLHMFANFKKLYMNCSKLLDHGMLGFLHF